MGDNGISNVFELASKDSEIKRYKKAGEFLSRSYSQAFAAKDREIAALRAAWKIAEPHLPQDVYRRALAALEIKS